MKTVSIVIPTFNRAKLLPKAIESSINQTYPCEIIVCDHGSTDNTPDVVAKYKDKVRYIRRNEDNGPIVCWRDGIEQATGEIVHLNYDDDWIDPEFIERTLQLLKDDVGFVYSNAMLHFPDKTRLNFRHPAGIRDSEDIIRFLMGCSGPISPGCALLRREDALKNLLPEIPGASGVYGKNSGVGEDLLIIMLTALGYPKYAYLSDPLAHFLAHNGSITIASGASDKSRMFSDAYGNARRYFVEYSGWSSNLWQDAVHFVKWNYGAGILFRQLSKRFEQLTWKPIKKKIRSLGKAHD